MIPAVLLLTDLLYFCGFWDSYLNPRNEVSWVNVQLALLAEKVEGEKEKSGTPHSKSYLAICSR
jgi:hypothetical protein